MREIAAQSLVGLPVYSLNEGETLGYVKQLIIDPAGRRLLALAVDKKGPRKNLRIIPSEKIHHLGADAVTISERNAANRAANLPQLMKYLNRPNHLIGNRLISDDGQTLGKIEEYYLDSESHEICRLDINGTKGKGETQGRAAFNGRHIISIGPAAVMINRAALENPEMLPAPPNPLSKVSRITKNLTTRISSALENERKPLKKTHIKRELFQSSDNSKAEENFFSTKTTDNMHRINTSTNIPQDNKKTQPDDASHQNEAELQAECITTKQENICKTPETASDGNSDSSE